MIWISLFTVFTVFTVSAEEVINLDHEPEIVIFHYGLDPILSSKMALNYVQSVSDHPRSQLTPLMMDAVFPVARSYVLDDVPVDFCLGYAVSPVHLTKTIQEMDYALSYFELDKALELGDKAQQYLSCLSEPPKLSLIAELFLLEGLVHFYKEDLDSAKESFKRSISFTPNLDWEDTFGLDAQPLFEEARKAYAQLKTVPLQVYPKKAEGLLWINGLPVLRDTPLLLIEGVNHIQILGSSIENIGVEVNESTGQVRLIVPSALQEIGMNWLEQPSRREEMGTVIQYLYPKQPTYFVSLTNIVWKYDPHNSTWADIEIPISAKVFSLETRRTLGSGLFWGGLTFTTVYGGKTAQNYAQLNYLANTNASSWSELNSDYTAFQESERLYQQNAMTTAIGLGVTGLGWLMSR
jgi:hypothetical protein